MNVETYIYTTDDEKLLYDFYSIGNKGTIAKIVIYEIANFNHFNLAFGDYDAVREEINEISITNNGDTIKVLATVIETIKVFFQTYPYAILDIRGSTTIRTKLYQKIIRDNWAEIETEFRILAFKNDRTKPEIPDFTQEYQLFQITKKH